MLLGTAYAGPACGRHTTLEPVTNALLGHPTRWPSSLSHLIGLQRPPLSILDWVTNASWSTSDCTIFRWMVANWKWIYMWLGVGGLYLGCPRCSWKLKRSIPNGAKRSIPNGAKRSIPNGATKYTKIYQVRGIQSFLSHTNFWQYLVVHLVGT